MRKTVAIVHFNTPELTEAAILSIRKHGGKDYRIVVSLPSRERGLKPALDKRIGINVLRRSLHGSVD